MRRLFLKTPAPDILSQFLMEQAALDFSYSAVGATAAKPPAGYVVDRTRIELGAGESVFEAAKAALQHWQQLRLGWVETWSPDTPIEAGQQVAIMGWAVGFWRLNCCRIVNAVDESGEMTRFGFAHGTLPGHVESGEERFLIEWDRNANQVSYDILAFSKPNHILSRLTYPLVRRCQKRFGRDSAASMFRSVNAESQMPTVLQSTT